MGCLTCKHRTHSIEIEPCLSCTWQNNCYEEDIEKTAEINSNWVRKKLQSALDEALELGDLTLEQEVYSFITGDFRGFIAICNAVAMRKSEIDDSDEMGGCR